MRVQIETSARAHSISLDNQEEKSLLEACLQVINTLSFNKKITCISATGPFPGSTTGAIIVNLLGATKPIIINAAYAQLQGPWEIIYNLGMNALFKKTDTAPSTSHSENQDAAIQTEPNGEKELEELEQTIKALNTSLLKTRSINKNLRELLRSSEKEKEELQQRLQANEQLLTQLQEQCKKLQEELAEKQQAIETLSQEKEELQQQLTQLEAKLAEKDEQIQKLSQEKEELQHQLQANEQQLKEKDGQIHKLSQENQELQQQLKQLQEQYKKLQEELDSLREENEALKEALQAIQQLKTDLQKLNDPMKLQNNITLIKACIENIQKLLESSSIFPVQKTFLERLLANLVHKANEVTQAFEEGCAFQKIEQQQTLMLTQLGTISDTLKNLGTGLSKGSNPQQLEAVQKELEDLQEQKRKAEKTLTKLRQTYESQQKKLTELQETSERRLRELEEENKKIKAQNKKLQKLSSSKNEELSKLHEELNGLQNELFPLKKQQERAKKAIQNNAHLRSTLADLISLISEATTLKQLKQDLEKLLEENPDLATLTESGSSFYATSSDFFLGPENQEADSIQTKQKEVKEEIEKMSNEMLIENLSTLRPLLEDTNLSYYGPEGTIEADLAEESYEAIREALIRDLPVFIHKQQEREKLLDEDDEKEYVS